MEDLIDHVSFGKSKGYISKLSLYSLKSKDKGTKGLSLWYKALGVELSFKVTSKNTISALIIDSKLVLYCRCILSIYLSVNYYLEIH